MLCLDIFRRFGVFLNLINGQLIKWIGTCVYSINWSLPLVSHSNISTHLLRLNTNFGLALEKILGESHRVPDFELLWLFRGRSYQLWIEVRLYSLLITSVLGVHFKAFAWHFSFVKCIQALVKRIILSNIVKSICCSHIHFVFQAVCKWIPELHLSWPFGLNCLLAVKWCIF